MAVPSEPFTSCCSVQCVQGVWGQRSIHSVSVNCGLSREVWGASLPLRELTPAPAVTLAD
jgi:hypothetical protein